ncbi:MAG: heavy metal translocating P-type ATPase [Nanoarchaeota archaeon]|nr:heavy metal translocating P-type ATPase [Nanoarchaeota archaeon]
MKKITMNIEGMHCVSCAQNIERYLGKMHGIKSVKVNFPLSKLYVDSDGLSDKEIINAVSKIGNYTAINEENVQIDLKIVGMTCTSCSNKIEKSLKKLRGIKEARVNFATSKANIIYSSSEIAFGEIVDAIKKEGYKVVKGKENVEDSDARHLKEAGRKMWIATFFTTIIMVLMMIDMFVFMIPYYLFIIAVLGIPIIFFMGFETHKSAIKSAIHLRSNMDTLVTLGSLVPYMLSLLAFWFPVQAFIEMATTILTLHLVGRYLEARARGRASEAIKRLLSLGAKNARIIFEGEEKEIPIEELRIGDVMIIKPGEKIPTDGIIISGESNIDESMATGESFPVEKHKGDLVIGSTINKNGVLKVKATKIGKDTFLNQIIKLVEECQGSKVPIQEFADRITGYFVPAIILLAIGAFFSWIIFPEFHLSIIQFFNLPWSNPTAPILTLAILATTAVLVISCPCALGLATPTALMVGSGLGAERGILIRKGEAIQTMKDVKVIVFDKTGTITKGKPEVTDIVELDSMKENEILLYASSLENSSEHPLASAIIEKAKSEKVILKNVTKFKAISGMGIEGIINRKNVVVGNRKLLEARKISYRKFVGSQEKLEDEAKTAMFVAIGGKVMGIIAVADTLKESSQKAIKDIEEMGIKTAMITGDNKRTAKAIAKKIGLDYVISDVLPEGKVEEIKKLQEKYGMVAMVGDGINDAPALKQANVGIAMGTGTDVAIEAADITLVRGDLSAVVSSIRLSNATFKKIKQNYFWAWFYNGVAIPAAFFGLLHPMIGAGAMAASSLNVVLNSLRLKKAKI